MQKLEWAAEKLNRDSERVAVEVAGLHDATESNAKYALMAALSGDCYSVTLSDASGSTARWQSIFQSTAQGPVSPVNGLEVVDVPLDSEVLARIEDALKEAKANGEGIASIVSQRDGTPIRTTFKAQRVTVDTVLCALRSEAVEEEEDR